MKSLVPKEVRRWSSP